ncbi:hypothetical protein PP175_23520 [Aneurinibacillus sp. Ricciae_BoGa-3]|uniref:hypothetical protein n=1 Tax=Aneurinibacillus sp. Ricciae_BoGa-3 TaxID=3022697 RepID=UPI00233FA8B1|nr:hypothetical protein [Aneurinibacillus sp. Ricciae_BoGa-3]WCK54222.1 hypothetical protein PP175_23520 [Aneurinibacillus sp. Ricciae_BoGa-3]
MYRTQKVSFISSKTTVDALFALNRLSAEVWNTCLNEGRAHHLAQGKWIDKSTLQKALKKRFPMHSQCVQSVCHRYLCARQGAWEARKAGFTNIRYPYKQKRHFNTRWAKDGFTVHPDGRIELARGIWNGKRQAPLVVRISELPAGSLKEIELVYDRGLKLAISYDDEKKGTDPTGSHVCAIDPAGKSTQLRP